MIGAKVITDSVTPDKVRLVTLQLVYPRFIHSELMTHRVFSRNAASSRAIPIQKMIEQVEKNPAMPVYWGKNQAGMQAKEELEYFEPRKERFHDGHRSDWDWIYSPREQAQREWCAARNSAVEHAKRLVALNVHKQIVNRILEPWQEMQTIVTATEWDNFYKLRRHPDAQPEIKALADEMWIAMQQSESQELSTGDWHLPYVTDDDICEAWDAGRIDFFLKDKQNIHDGFVIPRLQKLSAARCARVSYLNHDKTNPDTAKDEELHDRLLESGHFSPFEHQATVGDRDTMYANFRGWKSYRNQLGF